MVPYPHQHKSKLWSNNIVLNPTESKSCSLLALKILLSQVIKCLQANHQAQRAPRTPQDCFNLAKRVQAVCISKQIKFYKYKSCYWETLPRCLIPCPPEKKRYLAGHFMMTRLDGHILFWQLIAWYNLVLFGWQAASELRLEAYW